MEFVPLDLKFIITIVVFKIVEITNIEMKETIKWTQEVTQET